MAKNYDLIATVDIDIATPLVDDTSFDNLLLVGPLPQVAPETAPPQVGVYSNIDEVTDAGWKLTGSNPDPIALAAQVAFAQSPSPTRIYIAPIQMINTSEDEETPVYVAEDAVEAIKRAMAIAGWYVVCTAGVSTTEYPAIAAYIETQEKMFCYTELGFFSGETNAPTVSPIYFRTCGIYGRETTSTPDNEVLPANKYINVAFVAKWLFYSSGSETTAFKALSSVEPSVLTTTEMTELATANLNYFVTVGSKNISMNGKTLGGEWCDVIRFRDWLKNDMQVRVVNLFITQPKIPYTDEGIALVHNQMLASLKAGQTAGGIANDEFDEDGNRIAGFVTSVPLASSLTAAEKASRQLKKCRFKARLAGAIHFAELKGSLTYEL